MSPTRVQSAGSTDALQHWGELDVAGLTVAPSPAAATWPSVNVRTYAYWAAQTALWMASSSSRSWLGVRRDFSRANVTS